MGAAHRAGWRTLGAPESRTVILTLLALWCIIGLTVRVIGDYRDAAPRRASERVATLKYRALMAQCKHNGNR